VRESSEKIIEFNISSKEAVPSYYEGRLKIFFYFKRIFPKKAILKGEIYKINKASSHMYINSYCVTICDGQIRSVNAFGFHPNVDPKTSALCLPSDIPNAPYNQENHNRIKTIMRVYNLDSCHYNPMKNIQLEKLVSLPIKILRKDIQK
jgi:hypothetical protein